MIDNPSEAYERTYGCTFGCGNPYDYIVVSVADGTTEFLCIPCYVKLAADMVTAITDPDDPIVKAAMADAALSAGQSTPGPKGKARGKNAPVTADDASIIEAYDSVITVAELPEEFR
jgi:hypothetical protein